MEGRGRVRAVRESLLISRRSALTLGVAIGLAACDTHRKPAQAIRIGMVTDAGGLGDRSFNDSANAGLQAAKRRLHVATVVLQSRSVNDYQLNLMALSNAHVDELFSIGYDEALDLGEVAPRFPNQHFSIIDAVVDAPNVTSVLFRAQEGSFLAGALAALTTKTKTIGFLGGVDVPIIQTFAAGYTAGARQIDPAVNVVVKYIGSFTDVAAGKELAGTLYAQHADIIYAAAGKAGLGAIELLRSGTNLYAIGVDSDQDALVPGRILTSVLKRIDVSVFALCELAAARRTRPRRLELGLREGAVGLTECRYSRDVVSPATFALLARIKRALISGKIVAPPTLADLARYTRVSL